MPDDHYDVIVIVIGSGPGGASLAHRLAPTGKRILMLERGGYLPRSRSNWDAKTVFVDGAYQADETWHDKDGGRFKPALHYWVGGNSKVYGSALFRLRERDFGELRHKDGISPAWPLGYDVFEPYYTEAEALYHVHGQRGEDPTEPWSSAPYAYPPVQHEPRIKELSSILAREGMHPFHLPLGIKLDQNPDGGATTYSPCIRCDAFDGFPCAINAKADALGRPFFNEADVPIARDSLRAQAKAEWLTFRALPFPGEDGAPASPLDHGDHEEILNSLLQYALGKEGLQAFLENQITNTWTAIEVLYRRLCEDARAAFPHMFAAPNPAKPLRFTSLLATQQSYKQTFGAGSRPLQLLTEPPLEILASVRNVLEHNAGICDERYLKRAAKYPQLPRIKPGEKLQLDGAVTQIIIQPAINMVASLIRAVDAWVQARLPPP